MTSCECVVNSQELEAWSNRVAGHPVLSHSFVLSLTCSGEEKTSRKG